MTFSCKDRKAKDSILSGFGTVLNLVENRSIAVNNDVVNSFFFDILSLREIDAACVFNVTLPCFRRYGDVRIAITFNRNGYFIVVRMNRTPMGVANGNVTTTKKRDDGEPSKEKESC